jgi:hypothetical protein
MMLKSLLPTAKGKSSDSKYTQVTCTPGLVHGLTWLFMFQAVSALELLGPPTPDPA